ncbi:hypothetical protein [Povalibacter sp.]|uniref:hypothetical protein n=1 Tax=Povalibacter sp. TaxID=1962978 RepID=UPI002F3E923D
MRSIVIFSLLMLAGCASSPEQAAHEAATDRFETCMDNTLASFGPFRFGTQESRLKAAEICRDVMKTQ